MEGLKTFAYLLFLYVVHIIKFLVVDPVYGLCQTFVNLFSNKQMKLKSYFAGKTVLVTGASSGIGEALCLELAALGGNVILTSRNSNKLNEVASHCQQLAPQGKFVIAELDMENYHSINYTLCDQLFLKKLVETGLQDSGIDVAILNAGMSCRGSVADTDIKTIEKLMATNFMGPAALAKCLLPHFFERNRGTIAVVSSVQGKMGMPLRSAYAASKYALQGFFDSLRAEVLCKNINILTVSPGYVRTSLSVNAVNGDGTSYGKLDETTANGMDPKTLSAIILEAIVDKKKDVVAANAKTVLGIQLNALLPDIFTQMVKLNR
mgnify:CR=1 FL=1